MNVPLYGVRSSAAARSTIEQVLASGRIAGGEKIAEFESLLGSYLGNDLTLSTSDLPASVTMSLYLAGVRPGDEVVCSPMVCLATSMPINTLFARTRWCDVNPNTGNIDPASLADVVTEKTKAVLVFHWGGMPADLTAICDIAHSAGARVVDDASESLGTELSGRKLGATGSDFTCFSFYPNKPLSTGPDGGAISFRDPELYERARWMRRFSIHQPSFRTVDGEINPESDISEPGWSSALSNLGAALGVAQFEALAEVVERARDTARFYDSTLASVPGVNLVEGPSDARPAPWIYTLLAERRDVLMAKLKAAGVQASRVHLRNDLYSCFDADRVELPGVDAFTERALSVPCGWWVTNEQRQYVVDTIKTGW